MHILLMCVIFKHIFIKFMKKLMRSILPLVLIVSCGGGGGGGGGESSPTVQATPSYTIISGNIYTSPIPNTIYIIIILLRWIRNSRLPSH